MAPSPYFAAVDLGSNSFHMLIARFQQGVLEIVDREKDMVQIARGLDSNGHLSQAAQQRALDCLARFSERLRDIPEEQIRAVGTKTLRSAHNSKQFLQLAERALGHSIDIISGYEEARLVYQGLALSVTDDQRQRLVIDIGGASTEFIIGQNNKAKRLESLNVGCVALTNQFFSDSIDISKSIKKAYMAACNEIETIRKPYVKSGWDIAFGTSGTMKAVAAILNYNGASVIRYEDLCALMQKITQGDTLDDFDIPKLRRDVLPAGIAIIKAICDQLKIDTIHVSDASLKEGLIFDAQGRFTQGDIRDQTIQQLLGRFNIDEEQANRVSNYALNLWQQIRTDEPRLIGVSRNKVLRWASLLHECGLSIGHSGHHHHGYYLLNHSDLAGFGRLEQFCIASLVRFHRKKITSADFEGIDESIRPAFNHLLVCLRLAVRLNRGREDQHAPLTLSMDKNSYVLSIEQQWLELNPLTHAGLLDEIANLNNINIQLVLQEK